MSEGRDMAGLARRAALPVGLTLAAAGAGYAALRAARRRAGGERVELSSELALPPETRHLDVPVRDGGSVHLADLGEGPPIVFLHGVTLAAEVWAYQFHDLAARHRLIALDLRGHGDSVPGEAGMTIAAMADDVADVLEALDLRQVTLVGHSMGGMTLLRFARRHPDVLARRVGAVAIVASSGGIAAALAGWDRLAPRVASLVVAGHAALGRSGREVVAPAGLAARGARLAFGRDPDPAAVAKTAQLGGSLRSEHFVACLPELLSFDERAVFEDLAVPCVVVVGEQDRLTPPRYAKALAATLPGARLVVWPGAGHMLMYERREALDDLLDSLSAAAVAEKPTSPGR